MTDFSHVTDAELRAELHRRVQLSTHQQLLEQIELETAQRAAAIRLERESLGDTHFLLVPLWMLRPGQTIRARIPTGDKLAKDTLTVMERQGVEARIPLQTSKNVIFSIESDRLVLPIDQVTTWLVHHQSLPVLCEK